MSKKTIVIIFGTSSLEHSISVKAAYNIALKIMASNKYNVFFIGINKHNIWKYSLTIDGIIKNKQLFFENCPNITQIGEGKINNIKIDCAFLTTYGKFGEDGNIQGYLNVNKIPFIGSDVIGSACGFNKSISKFVAKCQNINVVPFVVIHKQTYNEELLLDTIKHLGNELVIKIDCGGSSIGVYKCEITNIFTCIKNAFKLDHTILIEKFILCDEFSVGIIEHNGELEYSDILKLTRTTNERVIFDFEYKYVKCGFKKSIYQDILPDMKETLRNYSATLFRYLKIKNHARFDFFLCLETNQIYFNEVNTLPTIGESSFFPFCFSKKYSFPELIDIIIQNTIRK
jgi:D-alanine-D-alanine ligase